MGKQSTGRDSDQQKEHQSLEFRLARAISHPVRCRILIILNRSPRPMAPSEIFPTVVQEFPEADLSNVSYHTSVLAQLGVIEAVEELPGARGPTKTTYRSCARIMLDEDAWSQLSLEAKAGVSSLGLDELSVRVTDAVKAKTFDSRNDRILSSATLTIDEEGWREIVDVLGAALHRVFEIEGEAATRISQPEADSFRATVSILSFESPEGT